MNKKSWPALGAVIGLTAACGTTIASHPDNEVVNVRLTAAPQNTGKIAQATLVPRGDTTQIVIFVSGVPSNVARPAHLYTYIYAGACGSLGPKPAIEMNQRVVLGNYLPYRPMQMSKEVPVALSDLRSGDYAIVVRTSPADGFFDIFCGNLKQAA